MNCCDFRLGMAYIPQKLLAMQLTKVIIFCLLHKKYTLKIISTPAKKKGMYHVY
jgi:hypothetical protein